MPRPRKCVAAVACALSVTALSTVARADTTDQQIEATRADVARVAQDWFDSTAQAARLEAAIAATEQQLADALEEAELARERAQTQAVQLYTGSSTAFDGMLAAEDALDTARRAELFGRADDEARRVIHELSAAVAELEAQRDELEAQREAQAELTAELEGQQAALDAQLAQLEDVARREAKAEQEARAEAAKRNRPRNPVPSARPAPVSPPAAPAPVPEPVSVDAPGDRGAHPRHDEPFLVCTRERESRGDYTVINPAGYYGAYQFLQTTWDVTASRSGRLDLVGVLPSSASAWDQDELAWVLYQWQGNRPWNGRC